MKLLSGLMWETLSLTMQVSFCLLCTLLAALAMTKSYCLLLGGWHPSDLLFSGMERASFMQARGQ